MDATRVYRAEGLAGLGRGGSAPGYGGGGGGGTGGEGGTPGRTPGGLGIGNVPAGQPGRAPIGGVGSPGEPGGAGFTPGRPSRPGAIPGAPLPGYNELLTNPTIRATTAELIARGWPADLATRTAISTIEGLIEAIRSTGPTGARYSIEGIFQVATTIASTTSEILSEILAGAPPGVRGLSPEEIASIIRNNPVLRDAVLGGIREGIPPGTTLGGVPGFNPVGPGGPLFGPDPDPTDPGTPGSGTAPSPETPGGGESPGDPPPPAPEPPPVVPLRPLPPRNPGPAPDPGTEPPPPPPPPPLEPPPETAPPPGEPVAVVPEGQLPDIIPDIEEPSVDDLGDELAGAGGGGAGRFRTGAFSGGRLPATAERTDFDQGETVFTRGARRNVYRPYPALAERTRRLRL